MKKKNHSRFEILRPRILVSVTLFLGAAWMAALSFSQANASKLSGRRIFNSSLSYGVAPVISAPLSELPTTAQIVTSQTELGDTERRLVGRQTSNPLLRDPVVKTAAAAAAMPPVGVSFEGMNISQGCGGCLPPDTDGAVGPNHYVQMVNTELAVYNKTTGAMISGPTPIKGLWTSGECSV